MFKKSLVLIAALLSSTALADAPASFTPAELRALITGDGRAHEGQETWQLNRNYNHGQIQITEADVLNLINNGQHVSNVWPEYHAPGAQIVTYSITGYIAGAPRAYSFTLTLQP